MDLPSFDLRLLNSFVVLADELHFGRAAAALGMAQPRLSQQIARLEQQLATRLLDRRGGRVDLTPAGAAVLVECRAILTRASLAEVSLRGAVLRVHLGDAMHPIISGAVATFADEHHGIEVRIVHGSMSASTRALDEGHADIAFDLPGGAPAGATAHVLDSAQLGVICPPDHRIAGHANAAWTDLDAESMIAAPAGIADSWNDLLQAEIRRSGVSVTTVVGPRLPSPLYVAPLIQRSGALMLCTRDHWAQMPPGLAWRPLVPRRDMAIAIIWDDTVATPVVHSFVDHTIALARARGHLVGAARHCAQDVA